MNKNNHLHLQSDARKRVFGSAFHALFVMLTTISACAGTYCFPNGWGPAGMSLSSQNVSGVELVFSLPQMDLTAVAVDGETMQSLHIAGAFLPNQVGAPDLPTISRFLAIPQGAQASVEVLDFRTQVLHDVNLIPAREIPLENSSVAVPYWKDPVIYATDACYPAQPVRLSPPTTLRGMDAAILSVTPFGYNPITRDLNVYTDLRLKVNFSGGSGQFGDDRLRSRWWEPVLKQNVMNYASLPGKNFDLLDQSDSNNYEYVIIAPDDPDFLAWADTIRQWRTEQGILTGVIPLSEIGGNDTTSIKAYLQNAYETWPIPPVAALLLADYRPNGDPAGLASPLYCDFIADNIYADMDGNTLPDLVVSRITAENSDQLAAMVGKMLNYERTPCTDPYFYQHPVIAGSWELMLWFTLCNEVTWGYLHNELGKDPVREYSIGDTTVPDSLWSTNVNTEMVVDYFGPSGLGYIPSTPAYLTEWGGSAGGLNHDMGLGAFFVQYCGHGGENGWCPPSYNIENLSALTNVAFPYVLSICCLTGRFDNPTPCFAEAMHRMEQGALGLTAASSYTYAFVNDVFCWGMLDYFWPDFDRGYGPQPPGETNLQPGFATVGGKYYLQASSWPYNPTCKIVDYYFFEHHGDAFMRLYSEVPQDLSVSHDSTIAVAANSFAVSADPGSLIALSRNRELIGRVPGTGAPTIFPLPPLSIGQVVRVTVTKDNYFRYVADVLVVDSSASVAGNQDQNAPRSFCLHPNHPNPFNPTTVLSFDLPVASLVKLEVFDINGRLVGTHGCAPSNGGGSTLALQWFPAGTHQITFDGSARTSGIYLARLTAGDFQQTQKLVLMK